MNNIYTKAAKSITSAFVLLLSLSILAVSAIAAPPNDNFANAQVISGVNNFVNGTNIGSTVEPGEPLHALNRGGGSVWYKYVSPGNGVLRINTGGSDFNTILAVYMGSTLANLKLVAANNNYDENNTWGQYANVRVGAKTGDVFYIAVDGNNNNDANGVQSGTVKMNYFFENAASNDNFANAIIIGPHGKQITTTTNVGASKEVGEPNHGSGGNPGGKSVWYKMTAPSGDPKSYTVTLDQSVVGNAGSHMIPLFSVYTGSTVSSLTSVGAYGGDRIGKITFVAQPSTTYYIAIDGYDFGSGAQLGNFMLSIDVTKSQKNPDFDRDGKADIGVYRPTNGVFYSLNSINDSFHATQWGLNGDKPLFNEIDGDDTPDNYVFRPDTQAWYTLRSFSSSFQVFSWGISTDIPLTLTRYQNGDSAGIATVFRQSTGTWWIYNGSGTPTQFIFGQNGDIPMTFDYNGDGTDEVVVFRPSNGTWYLANPFTGVLINAIQFGQSGDVPVPADYDGDGMADIAIYRKSTGTWWFRDSQTGAQTAVAFGNSTDKPQPADYDGDGKADIAIFRPTTGDWWMILSRDGASKSVHFGQNGDIPVAAPLY